MNEDEGKEGRRTKEQVKAESQGKNKEQMKGDRGTINTNLYTPFVAKVSYKHSYKHLMKPINKH
jgi:hypothetical protein